MRIRKVSITLCTLVLLNISAHSQTLFTYGTKPVSKDEFLKAFNKNPDTTGDRDEKVKQYLDLYINFKLKLQAATDEKLQASPEFKAESDNFKAQLTENHINEQANINGLISEAFQRSQKDILLSQVFVGFEKGDTTQAYTRIKQAYNSLASGQNFGDVTASFSTDESVVKSKGIIGYITVFTLPYEIENLVYGLKPGQYSTIYKSSSGYHIFMNEKERPAVGKRKIQQILIATPDAFSAEEKQNASKLADSVYKLLTNGGAFDKLANQYSAPNNNYDESNTTEVGVGQYSSEFESQVFSLQKPGDFTKPFQTYYGYNILKLVEEKPVSHDETDAITRASLQESIERDNRLGIARAALIDKWMKDTKYTKAVYNEKNLWSYTDSSIKKGKALAAVKGITAQTVLFSFAKQKITATDWVKYNIESRQPGTSPAGVDYKKEMNNFTKASCDRYYRSHIEDFYPPIASQVKEFNEANLLFAVMDKHVWSKAAEDSIGLKNYYEQHKQQYIWQPGVSALIVSAATKELLDSTSIKLRQNSGDWRGVIAGFDNKVLADSSRFENGQLPVKMELPMQKGYISQPEQNEAGDAYTMIYVFDTYTQPAQRSFDDARGMVINDYQQLLEQKWIGTLKKKYPVKVNDAVAKTL